MEKDSAQKLASELVSRFISLDKVQFDSVVNEYFDTECTQTSRLVEITGVSRIKHLAALEASVATESRIVGTPNYDPAREIIHFSYERTFHPPLFPFPPFNGFNNCIKKYNVKLTWDSQFQLNPSQNEQGETKLYITKIGPTSRRNTSWLEDSLPFVLIRPLLGFIFGTFVDAYSIMSRHPNTDENRFSASLSIIAEVIGKSLNTDVETKFSNLIGLVYMPFYMLSSIINMLYGSIKSIILFVYDTLKLDGNPLYQLFLVSANLFIQAFNIVYVNVRHLLTSLYTYTEDKAKQNGIPMDEYKNEGARVIRGVGSWFGMHFDTVSRNQGSTPKRDPQAPSYAQAVKEQA
ncbi:hypothetical protein L204_103669 [Cryptococcus depauperatus]